MSGLEIIFLSSSAITLGIGVVILLLNPRRMINQCSFLTALLSSLWLFCILVTIRHGQAGQIESVNRWIRMCNATAAFLPWALFLTKESILERDNLNRVLPRSVPWLLGCGTLVALVFSNQFLAQQLEENKYDRGPGYYVYLITMVFMCGHILVSSLRALSGRSGIAQLEIKFFAINFCFATLSVLLMFLLSSSFEIPRLRYAGAPLVLASFSTTLWAVCYYRVFDAKQIVLSFSQRGILLGILAATSVGLMISLRELMPFAPAIAVTVGIAVLLALKIDRPLNRWLGLDPADSVKQVREAIINSARIEPNAEELVRRFSQLLAHRTSADHVALLFLRDGEFSDGSLRIPVSWVGFDTLYDEGWTTPEALDRKRSSDSTPHCLEFLKQHRLGALIMVPRGSRTPSLILAMGYRTSLRPYTYPDIQLLLELAELMDNILTHAHVAARNAEIERMESAAMMSRGLAHDLNNLATPVSSFLLHMEGKVAPGTPEAEVLADAKHSIQVMQDYIRESLFFSRQLSPDIQPQSSAELFAATIQSTQSRARSVRVELTVAPGADVSFAADRTLMLRLLQNLVLNGIDATPPGGRVTLSAAALDGDRVTLCVADDGPGVPPDLVDRIFEPYFTTKDTGSKARGLGLGLAISLKIGALHGGTIRVGRATSGGALFTVTLPRSHPRST